MIKKFINRLLGKGEFGQPDDLARDIDAQDGRAGMLRGTPRHGPAVLDQPEAIGHRAAPHHDLVPRHGLRPAKRQGQTAQVALAER